MIVLPKSFYLRTVLSESPEIHPLQFRFPRSDFPGEEMPVAFSAHMSAQVSHNSLYLSVYLSNLRGQQSLCVLISSMNPRDYIFSLFNILPVVRVECALKASLCVCVCLCVKLVTGNWHSFFLNILQELSCH